MIFLPCSRAAFKFWDRYAGAIMFLTSENSLMVSRQHEQKDLTDSELHTIPLAVVGLVR
jgi:hypothetical protein